MLFWVQLCLLGYLVSGSPIIQGTTVGSNLVIPRGFHLDVKNPCFTLDMDVIGHDLTNLGMIEDHWACQAQCQKNAECAYFVFLLHTFPDSNRHGNCLLKSGSDGLAPFHGLLSGPKYCK
eukprot:maker-scaffold105_size367834-snap-gene-2.33 protein:Tk10186 transcript:maker-scaffold105_size367834-snap-gene-2.33-mRNA-1 annotation:"pan domain-containing protein"